jgi:tRNA(adenine34) deaminase
MMGDEFFMKEAVEEAKKALASGDWPIGCVIELDGKIIARANNKVYSSNDKLAHAEMIALEQAKPLLRENRKKATLYTTYEPCPMCFGAIMLSRIKRVVCGIDIDNSGAMHLKEHLPVLFKQNKWDVDFTRGCLAGECHDVFIKGEPTKRMIEEGHIKTDYGSKI